MKKPEHLALPLVKSEKSYDVDFIMDRNGVFIGSVKESLSDQVIRLINNYAALVEALRNIQDAYPAGVAPVCSKWTSVVSKDWENCQNLIEEALRKAGKL